MNPPNSEQNPPQPVSESAGIIPQQIATKVDTASLSEGLSQFVQKPTTEAGPTPTPVEATAANPASAAPEGSVAGQSIPSDALSYPNGAEKIAQSQAGTVQTSEAVNQPISSLETNTVAEHNPFFQESGTPAVLPSSDYQQTPEANTAQPVETPLQQTPPTEIATPPPPPVPETPLQTPVVDGASTQQTPGTEAATGQPAEVAPAPTINAAQPTESIAPGVPEQTANSVVTEFNEDGTIKSPFSYASEGESQQPSGPATDESSAEITPQNETTETPSNITQFPDIQESNAEKTNESDEPHEVANVIEFKNKAVEKIKGEIADNNSQIAKLQEHNTALEAEINEIEKGAQELSEDPVGALISLANRRQSEPLDKAA